MFTEETGTEVEVRYGDSAELAATIAEEGDNSPADVFFAQDPGSLGAVDPQLEQLPRGDPRPRGRGVPRRERPLGGHLGPHPVLVYNTDRFADADLPGSVLELTKPDWKDRVGIAPTNASFQAFVTAMRLTLGDDETRAWLEGMKANGAKTYEKNTPIVEAVAAGEIDAGLVNHYYLALVKEEQPDAPIANHLFEAETQDRSSASPAPECWRAPTRRTTPRRSSSSCSPTTHSGSTSRRPRRPSIRSSTAIEPSAGLVPLDEIEGPDVELDGLRRRAGGDASSSSARPAGSRERTGDDGGPRPGGAPTRARPGRGLGRRAAAPPARLPRDPGRGWRQRGARRAVGRLDGPARRQHGRSSSSASLRRDRRRRPDAWLVTRTDLPGRRLWAVAAALPLVIPSYVAAFCLLGLFGERGLLQQALGVERLPDPPGYWGARRGADALHLPVRLPAHPGGSP